MTCEDSNREKEAEHTHKCATGLLPMVGVGHTNQMIPFAAHLCLVFRSMCVMFFPSKEVFLYT